MIFRSGIIGHRQDLCTGEKFSQNDPTDLLRILNRIRGERAEGLFFERYNISYNARYVKYRGEKKPSFPVSAAFKAVRSVLPVPTAFLHIACILRFFIL